MIRLHKEVQYKPTRDNITHKIPGINFDSLLSPSTNQSFASPNGIREEQQHPTTPYLGGGGEREIDDSLFTFLFQTTYNPNAIGSTRAAIPNQPCTIRRCRSGLKSYGGVPGSLATSIMDVQTQHVSSPPLSPLLYQSST